MPFFDQTFWAGLVGVVYLPATIIPTGPAEDGLPIGVQIIGPSYGDLRTIQLAQRLEQMGFAFQPPPNYAELETGAPAGFHPPENAVT